MAFCWDGLLAMNENDHPLAKVLTNRNLDIRVSRLLILEWLPPEDDQTGKELAHRIRDLDMPVDYVQCKSKDEVLFALRRAAQASSEANVAIVHIEAHGEDGDDNVPRGSSGRDGLGHSALLSWEELGAELRPINLATKFNLIVVGAACYGEGLLIAVEPRLPVPFVVAVGYTGKVAVRSLRDALTQFYHLLLGQNWPFGEALDAANREHHFDTDSELRETAAARLVLESLSDVLQTGASPRTATLSQTDREAIERMMIGDGWRLHFAFASIPENRETGSR